MSLLLDSGIAILLTVAIGGVVSLYPTMNLIRSESYRSIRE